jgi:hypothetical protein
MVSNSRRPPGDIKVKGQKIAKNSLLKKSFTVMLSNMAEESKLNNSPKNTIV